MSRSGAEESGVTRHFNPFTLSTTCSDACKRVAFQCFLQAQADFLVEQVADVNSTHGVSDCSHKPCSKVKGGVWRTESGGWGGDSHNKHDRTHCTKSSGCHCDLFVSQIPERLDAKPNLSRRDLTADVGTEQGSDWLRVLMRDKCKGNTLRKSKLPFLNVPHVDCYTSTY